MANTDASAAKAAKNENADAAAAGVPGGRAGLKIHHLRPAPGAHIRKTRVGRGEASKGKTAGRGTKGSKARTTVSPAFEGGQTALSRRLPKLKGFSNSRFKTSYQVVNLDRLAALYPSGGDVTPDDLAVRGAVRRGELVKVLGSGEAVSGLRVSAHAFSASAVEKITAAGGSTTTL
ncbi:MAG TPA: 50S ribosomal protein L15 [Streptosporangiaceae bacterium]|nr:50S ribosomal protein L15 [Streptosporangiaceae bacterium]